MPKRDDHKQILKLHSGLKNAYKEVVEIQKSKTLNQTPKQFLVKMSCHTE